MFNKKYMLKTKKGILLTLLMIIVLILMMAELITYVTLNIGYDNLAADTSLAGSSSSFISSINPFISTFLHSSLFNAVNLMISYESNPKLRGDYFINNTNYQIYQIMNGNGINGYGNSIAFNIANYTKDLESEASAKGINLTIANGRLDIYQNSPVSISANYKAVAIVNDSGLIEYYPINASTSVSLLGLMDLHSAEDGDDNLLFIPNSSNILSYDNLPPAEYGSVLPFMIKPTKIYSLGGITTSANSCGDISSNIASNENSILLIYNGTGINKSVCGMAGIITAIPNSSGYDKPYLVYNESIINLINNQLLSNSDLSHYNVTIAPNYEIYNYTNQIKDYVNEGYYFESNYSSDYLQEAEDNPYLYSENGLLSFNLYSRKVAYFNGKNGSITIPLNHGSESNSFTWSIWVYPISWNPHNGGLLGQSNSGTGAPYIIEQGNTIYPKIQFSNDGGGSSSTYANVSYSKWQNIIGTYNYTNGIMDLYLNGVLVDTVKNNPISRISGAIYIGYFPNSNNYFNGSIANVQIYNESLSPSTISSLYYSGLNGEPISESGLVGWYPLNGNPNNYYNYSNNGTAYNINYTSYLN